MTALKTRAQAGNILVGFGMRNWTVFTGTAGLQDLCEEHFAALMPGNAFKWVNTQPTQSNFSFTEADDFVAWADARAMYLRCHTLVWHTSLAAWVAGAVNSGTYESIINAHIAGVLGHYPGRHWSVDVVNEAFNESDGEPGGFRDTLWYQAAGGSDYVPWAFERARVHAPNARLFLNEFSIDQAGQDIRRNNLYTAVEDWLSQGVPIDGIGMQSHLKMDFALDKPALRGFIRDLRGLGLEVELTELDCRNISSLGLDDAEAFRYIGNYTREWLTTALRAGAKTVIAWGVAPEDWAGTLTEQIASVPFEESPTFVRTSIASAMTSAFQATAVSRPTKQLMTVVEVDVAENMPALFVSTVRAARGEDMWVTVINGPATEGGADWVALYEVGDANNQDIDWLYLSNTQTLASPAVSTTTLSFTLPTTPDSYEFRFFRDGSILAADLLATSATIVVA